MASSPPRDPHRDIAPGITLTQFIMETQPQHSKGDFSLLMMALNTAIKVVEKNIRRAGIHGNFGYAGGGNVSGDEQAKLDIISNDAFKVSLIASEKVFVLGSEEEAHGVPVESAKQGCYIIAFDPLDGSSNIDANVSVGSIWGIWKVDPSAIRARTQQEATLALLREGNTLVSAGYAMYGSATNLVFTTGNGVNGFTLDSSIGEFLLTHRNMRMGSKRIYAVNEGNSAFWAPWFKRYVDDLKSPPKPYTARYIGSMVADVHRTILYGGVFAYPDDRQNPHGKLRYLYEAAPMALLVEQAGGRALASGTGQRILDIKPTKLHQRVPVFLGSAKEIDKLQSFAQKYGHEKTPAAPLPAAKL